MVHLAINSLWGAKIQRFRSADGADHLAHKRHADALMTQHGSMPGCVHIISQLPLLQNDMPVAALVTLTSSQVLSNIRTLAAEPMAGGMVSGCVISYSTNWTRRSAPRGSRPYAIAVSRYACALSLLRTPTRTLHAHIFSCEELC